jgi:hypothetical protein
MRFVQMMAVGGLCGAASAGTVQFQAVAGSATGLDSVSTRAVLSADANSFTITFVNQSQRGQVTGFYMEMGDAVRSLGQVSIANGDGVNFIQPGASPRDTLGSGVANAGTTGFGSVGTGAIALGMSSVGPGAGVGSLPNWAGTFFAMTRQAQGSGQDAGESLSVTFTHDGSFSLAGLIRAMAENEIRMYQRYGDFTDSADAGWLGSNVAVVVPLPAAAWAGLGLLGALGASRVAKRRLSR